MYCPWHSLREGAGIAASPFVPGIIRPLRAAQRQLQLLLRCLRNLPISLNLLVARNALVRKYQNWPIARQRTWGYLKKGLVSLAVIFPLGVSAAALSRALNHAIGLLGLK
jgi:hypothetical protein